MSYFKPYVDETGIHVPTYADTMEFLINGYKKIFGDDVYVGVDSPDYQLMALYAKASENLGDVTVDGYNARNPNWASGNALDVSVALNGIRRRSATYSKVELTLTGLANTVVPKGSLARDSFGYSWEIAEDVTFDHSGTAKVLAQCTTEGAINAAAHSITECETPMANWNTVNNELPAIRGTEQENDAQLRERRYNSVATPARSVLDGIIDSIRNVRDVQKVTVYDLIVADIKNKDGIKYENSHTIYPIVYGGSDDDIARTVFINKTPGIGTMGSENVNYIDEYGNSNIIHFDRPQYEDVNIDIRLTRLALWDETMLAKIKKACVDYIDEIAIGGDLIVPTLYSAIYQQFTGEAIPFVVNILKCNNKADIVEGYANSMFVCDTEKILISFAT